jgi:uroporphyrinogen-III decarboxylase
MACVMRSTPRCESFEVSQEQIMLPRERMLAAIAGKPVDLPPVAPLYLSLFLAEEIQRQVLRGYRAVLGEQVEAQLTTAGDTAIRLAAAHEALAWLGEKPDWLWAEPLARGQEPAAYTLRRQGERIWRIHPLTGQSEEVTTSANPNLEDRWDLKLPQDREEVAALVPDHSPEDYLGNGQLTLAAAEQAACGGEFLVCGTISSPYWHCYSLIGFHGLMTLPREAPRLCHYLLERQLAQACNLGRAYHTLGVPAIYIEECMTSADLISPRMYQEFVLPYARELVRELKALGLYVIFYMCGDVVPRLPRLAALGADALAVEESKKGFEIDLATVARAAGERCAVLGNFDATAVKDLDDAGLAAGLAAQQQAADAARGYIASTGSPFPLDTPRERVAAFIRLARQAAPGGQDGW